MPMCPSPRLLLTVATRRAAFTDSTQVDYATGNSPYYMAFADFNGDGFMDFAQVNSSDNALGVHLYTACP